MAAPGRSASVAQRLDGVAAPVDGMPRRHQRARLGEQQEQHAIDDGERLAERRGDTRSAVRRAAASRRRAACGSSPFSSSLERVAHAVAKRRGDGHAVAGGLATTTCGVRSRSASARTSAQQSACAAGPVDDLLEIELEMRARMRAPHVAQPERAAVEAHRPVGVQPPAFAREVGPERVHRRAPRRDDDRARQAGAGRVDRDRLAAADQPRFAQREAEQVEHRRQADVDDRPHGRRRSEPRTATMPTTAPAPRGARSRAGSREPASCACASQCSAKSCDTRWPLTPASIRRSRRRP